MSTSDWRTDEKVNGIRNLAHERFMDEVRQYEHGSTERVRLRWSFTQDELNALCAAVAEASRGGEDTARLDWLEQRGRCERCGAILKHADLSNHICL